MAGSINKVILVGNLGNDPEIKSMQDGRELANLSIATSDRWKDKATGEPRERTEWHRVVIFSDKLVEITKKYLRKGSKVYLEGALQTRKWQDQAGNDRYSTEVVVQGYGSNLTMLDRLSDRAEGPAAAPSGFGQASAPASSAPQEKATSFADAGLDDEIPF